MSPHASLHAPIARAHPASASSYHDCGGELSHRLRSLSRDDGSIDAAQVRVLGLDDIRAVAGERWPAMQEKVRQGSLAILRHHAKPEDLIVPAGDGFLVILAEDAPGMHQKRCQAMREALVQFYLGDDALANLRAEVTARSLPADGFIDLLATQPAASCTQNAPTLAAFAVCGASNGRQVAELVGPLLGAGAGARLGYNSDFILDGRHGETSFLDHDLAICAWVQRAMETAREGVFGVSVHASTMQRRRSRERYLGALGEACRGRQLAFIEVAEIEKGTPLLSISEWSGCLRAYTPKVVLDFHYSDLAIARLSGCGAWAAGFHLPLARRAQTSVRAGEALLKQIAFWARRLRGQGVKLAVAGFHDLDFLAESAARGVDLASGACLGVAPVD